MTLSGRHILVTGAARGLGAVIAHHLAEAGAQLTLADILDAEGREVADRLSAAFLPLDLRDPDSIRSLGAALQGPLHGLFNNGAIATGIGGIGFEEIEIDTWDKVMEVNVKGVYLGIKMMLPHMNDGASILITSSIAGLMGMPLNVAYTTSKHAVIGIRRACAAIGGKRGIRVNSLHPGFVDSAMLRRLVAQHPNSEASLRALKDRALLGRLVQPEEIAKAALFLASDESRAITNQGLVVDCGVVN